MHPSAPPPGTIHTPITSHQQRPTYPTKTPQQPTTTSTPTQRDTASGTPSPNTIKRGSNPVTIST
ncbi:hypothetical protein [Xylella fastidiosa]|uniref:hypothetical protein n=1 Tax=Xylella fastidiosa TaxID=2371 RepID=UPI00021444A6|nr:hypothetical protein [Xylella fastidiosa]EGO82501.1 hypothetical protein XFEB_00577 [Xylella fastidiosa EB92.1]